MPLQIFEKFVPTLLSLGDEELHNPDHVSSLQMFREQTGGRELSMIYAPFDHVNQDARVVIVGMTPGRFQAVNALVAARDALRSGASTSDAARIAKAHASFSGEPMRGNLIAMLDAIGVARWLGIGSTASLWADNAHHVHFTSALRYPVFVDGKNWSGTPDMVRTSVLRSTLEDYTGKELAKLPNALIVPLGPKVSAAMLHLADCGLIDADRVLTGLPHPSGANAERIAYFLGKKTAAQCSSKTNPATIDAAKAQLIKRVQLLTS